MTPHTERRSPPSTDRPSRNGILRRIFIAPFEVAIGIGTVFTALSGFFGWTLAGEMYRVALPQWAAVATNILYLLSGVAIIGGVIHRLRQVEAFGLIMLATSLTLRALVLLFSGGLTILTSSVVVNSAVFVCAALARLRVVLTGRLILLAEHARDEDKAEAVVAGAM